MTVSRSLGLPRAFHEEQQGLGVSLVRVVDGSPQLQEERPERMAEALVAPSTIRAVEARMSHRCCLAEAPRSLDRCYLTAEAPKNCDWGRRRQDKGRGGDPVAVRLPRTPGARMHLEPPTWAAELALLHAQLEIERKTLRWQLAQKTLGASVSVLLVAGSPSPTRNATAAISAVRQVLAKSPWA